MEKKSEDLLESFGQKLSGRALVKKISLAQQQMVEIAKAISVQSKIIIMDEPSILTDRELAELFDLIGRLKSKTWRSFTFHSPGGDLQSLRPGDRGATARRCRRIGPQHEPDQIIRLMVGRGSNSFSSVHSNLAPRFWLESSSRQEAAKHQQSLRKVRSSASRAGWCRPH
jgi:ABC-type sugar transport system ATPase subunit